MSKWILIQSENNWIFHPTVFDTYEDAYSEMIAEYNRLYDEGDEGNIHEDYASIQSDFNNWDWRISEIKF